MYIWTKEDSRPTVLAKRRFIIRVFQKKVILEYDMWTRHQHDQYTSFQRDPFNLTCKCLFCFEIITIISIKRLSVVTWRWLSCYYGYHRWGNKWNETSIQCRSRTWSVSRPCLIVSQCVLNMAQSEISHFWQLHNGDVTVDRAKSRVLFQCLSSVADGGQILKQHRANIWYLLDFVI